MDPGKAIGVMHEGVRTAILVWLVPAMERPPASDVRQHRAGGRYLSITPATRCRFVVDRRTGEVRDTHLFVAGPRRLKLVNCLGDVDETVRRLDRSAQ